LGALLLSGALLVGCGDPDAVSDNPGDAAPPAPQTSPAPPPESAPAPTIPQSSSSPTGQVQSGVCPVSHPAAYRLTPLTPAFADLVSDLFACTDTTGSSLHVENQSLVVWQLVNPALPAYAERTGDTVVDVFRGLMAQRPPTNLLLEPKRFVSFPMTEGFLLLPHSEATAVWQTVEATASVVEDYQLGDLADELADGSPGRQVVVDCGLAAFDAVEDIPTAEDSRQQLEQAPSLFVIDQLGLGAGVTDCASSLRTWQQARQPTAPAFADNFARELAQTHKTGLFSSVVRVVQQVSPRG